MSDFIRALVLGDIIGQPGCRALFIGLKGLVKKHKADLVVVNGENAAGGFGLTPEIADQLFSTGVDVITSGNHIWQKKEIFQLLDNNDRILRPANYPDGAPGGGVCQISKKDFDFAIINLQGRVKMYDIDSPFEAATRMVRSLKGSPDAIIVDFHAENHMEKEALALYLDGKVQAVVGTHTHIQTADERILPKGTAFISDLGMTGPSRSVIGVDPEISIRRSLTQMPLKMDIYDTPGVIRGVCIEFERTGSVVSIQRVEESSGL